MGMQTEDRAYGSVEKSLYRTYLRAWGPWYWLPILYLLGAATERFAQARNLSPSFHPQVPRSQGAGVLRCCMT